MSHHALSQLCQFFSYTFQKITYRVISKKNLIVNPNITQWVTHQLSSDFEVIELKRVQQTEININ